MAGRMSPSRDRTARALSFPIICPHPTPTSLKKNKQQCGAGFFVLFFSQEWNAEQPSRSDQATPSIILSGLIRTRLFIRIHFDCVYPHSP